MKSPASLNSHSTIEVFRIFLRLGLTSFGGPIAHIGYFRREFVERRHWIGESSFADLVALCQFLPGPASSQVGFAIGLSRAGLSGGVAAWTAFTLPSAILLFIFARLAALWSGPLAMATLHGLKIVAVAVVAQAVWGMARTLTPDIRRALIALAAGWMVLAASTSFGQIGAIAFGAGAGLALCRAIPFDQSGFLRISISPKAGVVCIAAFLALLIAAPLLAATFDSHILAVFAAFYRSGGLVFGGGHVVLPLLRDAVVAPGWISANDFLAGYGAAQAVPGPLFTVAAYLGAALTGPPNGIAGATLALIAIFLPGLLALGGALPFWDRVRAWPGAQAGIRGVNAAVVGILAAALYDPLWKSAIAGWEDTALAAIGFLLLVAAKAPPWVIVIGITAGAALMSMLR